MLFWFFVFILRIKEEKVVKCPAVPGAEAAVKEK